MHCCGIPSYNELKLHSRELGGGASSLPERGRGWPARSLICPAGARPASLLVLIGSQANERDRVILSKPSQVAAAMLLESTIVCPHCNHAALETMPTDACQFFYDCKG